MGKNVYQKPHVLVVKTVVAPMLTGTYEKLGFNPYKGTTEVLSREADGEWLDED